MAVNCPDCGEALQAIRLVDEAGRAGQTTLGYAAADAKPSGWPFGRVRITGRVQALMCPACARILLYGESPAEVTPEERPQGRGDEPAPTE